MDLIEHSVSDAYPHGEQHRVLPDGGISRVGCCEAQQNAEDEEYHEMLKFIGVSYYKFKHVKIANADNVEDFV